MGWGCLRDERDTGSGNSDKMVEFPDTEIGKFFDTSKDFTPLFTMTFLGVDCVLGMKAGSRLELILNLPRTDLIRETQSFTVGLDNLLLYRLNEKTNNLI